MAIWSDTNCYNRHCSKRILVNKIVLFVRTHPEIALSNHRIELIDFCKGAQEAPAHSPIIHRESHSDIYMYAPASPWMKRQSPLLLCDASHTLIFVNHSYCNESSRTGSTAPFRLSYCCTHLSSDPGMLAYKKVCLDIFNEYSSCHVTDFLIVLFISW